MGKKYATLLLALGVMKLCATEEILEVYPHLRLMFPQEPIERFKISPVESFTNKNYIIETNTGKYFLRIPGIGTENFIDRQSEYHNAKSAFEYGFNAGKILYFDTEKGIQLTLHVEGKKPLQWEDFNQKLTLTNVVAFLKRIHESDLPFQNDLNVFDRTEKLVSSLAERKFFLPLEYQELKNTLDQLQPLLSSPHFRRVPCHNDPIPSNFILMTDGLQLFDWEYAGINDPAWELALLSCVMGYSQELDSYLVDCYQPDNPSILKARLLLFKPIVEFWISLWAFSQIKIHPKSQDFFTPFATSRLQKCKDYINAPDFSSSLHHIEAYITQKN